MTGMCRITASAAWNGDGSVSVRHRFGRLFDDVASHLGSADKLVPQVSDIDAQAGMHLTGSCRTAHVSLIFIVHKTGATML